MILAAGRGERMRELTREVPKPLIRLGNRYLIEYVICNLAAAGITEIVINVSYLGEQIQSALGDGSKYDVSIQYSVESERLETGGGILKALPLLGDQPFLAVSCDIITHFPFQKLPKQPLGLAHLVMVDNPPYHPQGDFGLFAGRVHMQAQPRLTFANIAIYRPELFAECEPGHFRLTKVLFPAILANQVSGEHYQGTWYNIGTPEDLISLSERALA